MAQQVCCPRQLEDHYATLVRFPRSSKSRSKNKADGPATPTCSLASEHHSGLRCASPAGSSARDFLTNSNECGAVMGFSPCHCLQLISWRVPMARILLILSIVTLVGPVAIGQTDLGARIAAEDAQLGA